MNFLPLFPLNLVVFPKEKLNLHIFEERYRQLIKDCDEQSMTFGIPRVYDGTLADIGTEVRLDFIAKKYESGESDIKTVGLRRFKILQFYRQTPGKLYAGANVEFLDDGADGDYELSLDIIAKTRELFSYLNIKKELPSAAGEFSTFELGHHVGFSQDQEYEFLCLENEIARQNYMLAHLDKAIPMLKEMEQLQERVKLNGHFKNLIPPKV